MKETLAFLLCFVLIAFGSKFVYMGYKRLCDRLFCTDDNEHIAMLLAVFSMANVAVFLIMAYSAVILSSTIRVGSLVLAAVVVLIVDNIILLFGWNYLQGVNRKQLASRILEQKQKSELDYYRVLEEQYQRQRVLIHDIRHHLRVVREFSAEGDFAEIENYIDRLEKSPALQKRVHICSNRTLDAVLCRYAELCDEKAVSFSADVRDKSVDFLPPEDITAIYGNLLENAANATESGGFIEVSTSQQGSSLLISVVNTCGFEPETDKNGELVSRLKGHGLGLKSVKAAVKRCGGEFNQYYDSKTATFHTVILLDIPE